MAEALKVQVSALWNSDRSEFAGLEAGGLVFRRLVEDKTASECRLDVYRGRTWSFKTWLGSHSFLKHHLNHKIGAMYHIRLSSR